MALGNVQSHEFSDNLGGGAMSLGSHGHEFIAQLGFHLDRHLDFFAHEDPLRSALNEAILADTH